MHIDVCTLVFFFFQAEDGIRDVAVTGVQTCALPISYCFTNCSAARPKKTAKTASASRLIWVTNGAKSLVLRGVQIFWMIWPPLSSKVRWKPPTDSQPHA